MATESNEIPVKAIQVLVIDDEPAIRQVLASNIKRAGYMVEHVGSGEQALERLGVGDVDIAVCDIKMPDITGIDVVRIARERKIETTFLMMTAYASVDTAIDAMRVGAYDYMIKPLRNEDVLHRLEQIEGIIKLRQENRLLRTLVVGGDSDFCKFTSSAMQEMDRIIGKVAPTESTVLITGESGTGKGVAARNIHKFSNRTGASFIPVNCGAIPENLVESEFFGHAKGAFTGADRAKKGLFLEASGGTIFLDEIGELPLHLQVKLLHAIESKEVRAVGSEQVRSFDARIVAATNSDLESMVAEGSFREDLYFRLNVFQVQIPPLRERRDDIPILIDYFLHRLSERQDIRAAVSFDGEAKGIMLTYDWPGNVRELENVIERASILADDGIISVADLPVQVTKATPGAADSTSVASGQSLRDQVRAYEINVILGTIEECDGDRKGAADNLGIGLSTLYRKLEEFGGLEDV